MCSGFIFFWKIQDCGHHIYNISFFIFSGLFSTAVVAVEAKRMVVGSAAVVVVEFLQFQRAQNVD
jgi:hypothetical protein